MKKWKYYETRLNEKSKINNHMYKDKDTLCVPLLLYPVNGRGQFDTLPHY